MSILESMKEKAKNRANQSGSQSDRERTLLYARGGVSTRWKMCRLTCPAHTPVEPRLLGPSPGSTEHSHVSLHHSHPWYTGSCSAQSNQSPEAVLPPTASARGCPSSSPDSQLAVVSHALPLSPSASSVTLSFSSQPLTASYAIAVTASLSVIFSLARWQCHPLSLTRSLFDSRGVPVSFAASPAADKPCVMLPGPPIDLVGSQSCSHAPYLHTGTSLDTKVRTADMAAYMKVMFR